VFIRFIQKGWPLVAVFLLSACGVTIDQTPPNEGVVKTLAGTGAAGIADGPAGSATFLMPTALAHASDGTLYIADEAAQRIRSLSPDGIVRTLAGSGPIGPDGLSVKGGYADGPASKAQFSRPAGLALGPRGDLYIADSRNACVRKLAAGIVSTVVGVCGQSAATDGPRASARGSSRRALAFDGSDLYIADFGAGIRKVDAAGNLTTIKVHGEIANDFWGVAIGHSPGGSTLVGATPNLLMLYDPKTHLGSWHGYYAEGNRPFGAPSQLIGIDHRQFLFSDLRSSVVRYMRLLAPPFVTTVYTRTIAGGPLERTVENAGFRDGPIADSLFYAPRGIALAGDEVFVADSGNRRIRSFKMPHTRVSETGLADNAPYDASHYQIVYMGASWTFWDSLGDDSICARLERSLDAAHRFGKPVRCHQVRLDGASLMQMENYVANYLAGHVDLLIVNANLPEAFSLYPNQAPPSLDAAGARLHANVAAFVRRLQADNTKLFLVWAFASDDVSDSENLYEREETGHRLFPVDLSDNYQVAARQMIRSVADLPLYQYDTYPDFLRYEKSPAIPPLFGTDDSHMSNQGAALHATVLAHSIAEQRGI
jgi:hypothetical protein